MTIKKFEDLEIWQEARTLSKMIFQLTEKGAFRRDYKLKDQIKDHLDQQWIILQRDLKEMEKGNSFNS